MDVGAVDAALEMVARSKFGFEQPDVLFDHLGPLIGLTVVEQQLTRDSTRLDRVVAFRKALRHAVWQVEDERTRLACAILFFLLSEQELSDNGLSSSLARSGLGGRRRAIETLLGLTSRFRDRFEPRLRMQVAGELLRYEASVASSTGAPGVDNGASLVVTPYRQVRSVLRRVYTHDHDVGPLASLIIADREPFYDVSLHVILADHPTDPSRYKYQAQLTATADLREYTIALVSRPQLVDRLLALCPRITDAYACANNAEVQRTIDLWCSARDIVRVWTSREGRHATRAAPTTLSRVPAAELDAYVGDESGVSPDELALVRTPLPLGPTRFTTKVTLTFEKDDHYCFWTADRPLYLRQFSINVARFTPVPETSRPGKVTLQPFSMASGEDFGVGDTADHTTHVENWLVRGQGFVVIW